ncbi:hypothetical protein NDN08_001827 [Rhodosorus marinus]|uniref:Sugar phosphate phosphatase n=1 Tax=Rhodosorus marinus TaxID=101924 RepID=A0AAV8URX8_9RHOD|nr:hypothetical protein NDN08_001827 [Rhodosorus marinus]
MSGRIRTTILAKIPRENDLTEEALARLEDLDEELKNAGDCKLRLILDDGGPEVQDWNERILTPFLDRTWLSAPWAVAEFYFYRRVIEAVDYFKTREDPFHLQKELGLSSAIEPIEQVVDRVNAICGKQSFSELDFAAVVKNALWGNRMDLSIWPIGEACAAGDSNAQRAGDSARGQAEKMILSNDVDQLCTYVAEKFPMERIDIVVDNAGFELFCDLCLADYMISSGMAKCVTLQLKAHPTFVSDAMAKDVERTIDFLEKFADSKPNVAKIGRRMRSHVENGSWKLVENFFWVQPNAFWEMPADLRSDLQQQSSLTFLKGDANYRRLLGDCQWIFTTPFSDIANYFPSPICALRTFKAEIGCGLTRSSIQEASNEDPNWLVSGRYGVIQFLIT